jgi:TolB-like protein/cytochrome c-type biogenesis protein CcmH/NrfG
MSETKRAVFLSYASEDADAALRICSALRASGIEVWFDQSELRGGDAWDAMIRWQIKACALFIPIISENSHARAEGYFRLEWKLAVDRSHLIAPDKPFLVPVVIDQTRGDDLRVPDRFRELQWTPLPDGQTPPAFVERIARLLASDQSATPAARVQSAPMPEVRERRAAAEPLLAKPPDDATLRRARLSKLIVAAVAIIGLGYLALDRWVLPRHVTDGAATAEPKSLLAPGVTKDKSIAVLPFVDLSERKDQEYFSDGLTEELIDQLAQVPDMHVAARTSSFYFKGKQATTADIARALGVEHLLEGSVRKAGTTMRVSAELIRADNGYHMWASRFDRDVKDVFKVQDEIAAAVVEALKAKLLPTSPALSARRGSTPEAYNQYLLGRQFLARDNQADTARAAQAFRKAIAFDPNYASAWAGLADAMYWVADSEDKLPLTLADRKEARAAADKAVELQPDLAYGYLIRAQLRATNSLDFAGAGEDMQRALALEPDNAEVLRQYGEVVLTPIGKLSDAVLVAQRATKADPLNARAWTSLAMSLYFNGDLTGARAAAERSLEISPQQAYAPNTLAQMAVLDGRPADALKISQQSTFEAFRLCGAAMAQFDLGHHAEAQQQLNLLIQKYATTAAFQIAQVYARRGDQQRAVFWLERAHTQQDGGYVFIKVDPMLRTLHDNPHYRAMLSLAKLN